MSAFSSGVPSAGHQAKLMLVVDALAVKLDDEGADPFGFLASPVDTKLDAEGFMNAPANVEIRGGERFVACAEQLV